LKDKKHRSDRALFLETRTIFILFLLVSFVIPLMAFSSSVEGKETESTFVVLDIKVEGNEEVKEDTVLEKLSFEPGDELTRANVEKGMEKVREIGSFRNVSYELIEEGAGRRVVIKVEEYPLIEEIKLEGNDLVNSRKLLDTLKKAGIKEGEILDKEKLNSGLKKIQEKYREEGYPLVNIGNVDIAPTLTIEIVEGKLVKNTVRGLYSVPNKEALELIAVPEGKPIKLKQLQQSYENLRKSVFFKKVELVPRTGYSQSDIILYWQLKEREILSQSVKAQGIALKGNTVFSGSRLRERLNDVSGEEITNYDLLKALEGVFSLYADNGYDLVELISRGVKEGQLVIEIDEGTVSRIEIEGNNRTTPSIVRDHITVGEGQVFNRQDLQSSRRRLLDLGYFTTVEPTAERVDGGVVVTFKIEEKSRLGSVRGGLTFSGGALKGQIDVSRKNLFGLGQDVSLQLNRGLGIDSQLQGELSWKNIYFPDPLEFTRLRLYSRKETAQDESFTRRGLTTSLGYPLSRNISLGLSYTGEFLGKEEGNSVTNILSMDLTQDKRNNPIFPTRGSRRTIGVDKAGDFAPGIKFTKVSGSWQSYLPLPGQWLGQKRSDALGFRLKSTLSWDTPPAYTPSLGGPSSLRGIDTVKTPAYALLNSEYRVKLWKNQLFGSLFFDSANDLNGLNADNFYFSVGAEARVNLFGYLRIGVAWPISETLQYIPTVYFGVGPIF